MHSSKQNYKPYFQTEKKWDVKTKANNQKVAWSLKNNFSPLENYEQSSKCFMNYRTHIYILKQNSIL